MLGVVRAAVCAQPWRAVGMAALAGACVALSRSRNAVVRGVAESTLASLVAAARQMMKMSAAELAHDSVVSKL